LSNKHIVKTNDIEKEIWNFISSFESEYFVKCFAKDCISKKFHGLDYNLLNSMKNSHNENIPNEKVEILTPLQLSDINDELVAEISNNAKQARDFYTASKQLTLLSKPILLFYSFEKLANVLILLTYKINKSSRYSHGLAYHKDEPIKIKSSGLFQRFHDCYSSDSSLYLERQAFQFENILNAGELYDVELFDAMELGLGDQNLNPINENTCKQSQITELDREFLFMFGLSILARYQVNDWSEIIAGQKSDKILRIDRYLQSVQSLFPNLILNQLYGEVKVFSTRGYNRDEQLRFT